MIRRGPHRSSTAVPNDLINDNRLSLKARGLAAFLLTKHDEWRIDASALARPFLEGRKAVLAALKELETVGYLRRGRSQGPDGKWTSWSTLYESPEQAEEFEPTTEVPLPDVGSPNSGQPNAGEPTSGEPTSRNRTSFLASEKKENRELAPAAPAGQSDLAKSILGPFWDQATPRPVAGYAALLKRIEECLDAGHDATSIALALPTMPAFTRNAFDMALRKGSPPVAPEISIEEDREAYRRLGAMHAHRDNGFFEDDIRQKGLDPVQIEWVREGRESAQTRRAAS
jgi:hypothetical protein